MTMPNEEAKKIVSYNRKKYRESAGLTQIALSIKINKNPEYISKIERAVVLPSVEMIFKIAAALNIEPYKLLMTK